MKNIIYTALFALGLAVSAGANAGTTIGISAAKVTSGTGGQCELLGEDVVLSLSNNVSGAFHCDEVNLAAIYVATCHKGSSLKVRTVKCSNFGTANNTHVFNDTSCTGAAGETFTFTAPAYVAYVATSSGGSVSIVPSANLCVDSTVPGAIVDGAKTLLEAAASGV